MKFCPVQPSFSPDLYLQENTVEDADTHCFENVCISIEDSLSLSLEKKNENLGLESGINDEKVNLIESDNLEYLRYCLKRL